MTYDEMMAEQKLKYQSLAKMLDGFRHCFSDRDPWWDIPYPANSGKTKWGRCYASRYNGTTSFGFSNRAYAYINPAENKFELNLDRVWFGRREALSAPDDVMTWLAGVRKNPAAANRRIVLEYPKDERKGLVPRYAVERYIPDFYSIGKELGAMRARRFVNIFDSGYFWNNENGYVEGMTANQFFEYCRIAYMASEEKEDNLDRSLSGRDMYKRYSDGRYGALLDIDPDSSEEFMQWLDGKVPCDRHGGDHPWEIKRGGNTTHIDLYVHRVREHGWYASEEERKRDEASNKVKVGLRGHHIGRIVETVKMFLALHKSGMPIWIDDAESVRNRILGLDNIGIIPESDTLHRGWQDFPADFKVADVMHFKEFGRARRFVLPYVTWKPLPVVIPV